MDAVFEGLRQRVSSVPGAAVEHNQFSVSVHFRNCAEEAFPAVLAVSIAASHTVRMPTPLLRGAHTRRAACCPLPGPLSSPLSAPRAAVRRLWSRSCASTSTCACRGGAR